ncbi:2-nitropropane dioxygenase [Reticulomyxa filosa]|uniref:2-nitropropane dioxygenase n=1 Tax=Reticulomyxa filosa TaxID=46433 RepID=X6NNN2_RETFI|nr:2-nitropropane dioxygenase [Reticulomyxa filosa]|eukprot:ETO26982.1 2-nitropropane dioxygenase [Reticulomyxa filosa]
MYVLRMNHHKKSINKCKQTGAQAVWVGTRFVCSVEAGASLNHKQAIVKATYDDTDRTLIYSGRPLRVIRNDYVKKWETERKEEMENLLQRGIVPFVHEQKQKPQSEIKAFLHEAEGHLSGQVAGAIDDIKPAKEIFEDMMTGAIASLKTITKTISVVPQSKL